MDQKTLNTLTDTSSWTTPRSFNYNNVCTETDLLPYHKGISNLPSFQEHGRAGNTIEASYEFNLVRAGAIERSVPLAKNLVWKAKPNKVKKKWVGMKLLLAIRKVLRKKHSNIKKRPH